MKLVELTIHERRHVFSQHLPKWQSQPSLRVYS